MRKPRILMLGWEFPPNITGGLGVACYHIVKELHKDATITLVLPSHSTDMRIAGVRIIGIGNLNLDKIFSKKERANLRIEFPVKASELTLSPYPVNIAGEKSRSKSTLKTKHSRGSVHIHNLFADTDIYGDDVVAKVRFYAEICNRLSKKIGFDIIHAHDWMTFPAALAIQKNSGKPLFIHIHSLNIDRVGPDDQGWIFNLEKESLMKADLIIPVSHYTGKLIHEHYGIARKKILPVHNGVREIKPFRSPKKFPEKLILFLGRVTYQKGPEYFLELAGQVIHKYNNVRFVIAGAGDQFNRIVEDSAYKELSHKFHFTGFITRSKSHELFSMTDIFVMPSVSEPFGIAAMEAAKFGIPLIISKRSGAAEVLKGSIHADFWDIETMEKAIIRLLTDEKFRDKVVAEQFRNLETLSWENTAGKILDAYTRILQP